jgi:hypothetical protein
VSWKRSFRRRLDQTRLSFLGLPLLIAPPLAASLAEAPPASADGNYYGIAELDGSAFYGAQIGISSSQLQPSDVNNDFADNDLWVSTQNSETWIEAGLINGTFCSSGYWSNGLFQCTGTTKASSLSYFWGESRPSGLDEHLGPAVNFNTRYDDNIGYNGGGQWGISLWPDSGSGPYFGGTSATTFTAATVIQTGTEIAGLGNPQAATVCSDQMDLNWLDQNYVWHYGWSDASNGDASIVPPDNPPNARWVSRPSHLRDWANASC